MARGSLSRFKKFLIVAGVLIVLEAGYIMYFSSVAAEKTPQEVIQEAMKKAPGGGFERQVQIAIQLYRAENNGKLPDNLAQLIPNYMASQPVDATTGKPLAYRVEGDKFVLGSGGSAMLTRNAAGADGEVGKPASDEMTIQTFLKALSEPPNARLAHYDPTSKRDPFRPFDLSERTNLDVARTPLQSAETSDLALTAVLERDGEATALIETPDGMGHSVKKGDKVGLREGEVVEISPDKVVVLEKMADFTGEVRTKTVEIARKASRGRDDGRSGQKSTRSK